MVIFKKSDEVYDYTLLQKKGFLKKEEDKKSIGKISKDGYFELGERAELKVEEANSEPSANPLNFFDAFAPSTAPESNPLANFDVVSPSTPSFNVDAKDLSVKIEDFEYKLSRIAEKLALIEEKLSRFEERVK